MSLTNRIALQRLLSLVLSALLLASFMLAAQQKPQQTSKLPKPRRLDRGLELRRDPSTGELRGAQAAGLEPGRASGTIRARVSLVEVNCTVSTPDGASLRGLTRDDFRLFEDGVQQPITHFDASTEPASIVLVLDASPSIFRELGEMKAAARVLASVVSPLDEVAVVAFAGQTQSLLPFSRHRVLLERAIDSPVLAQVTNSSESNIYQSVYLTVRELFGAEARRPGRKAIVLLTDGQDSGLGLSWDPASTLPQPGAKANRLTFEDVTRALGAAGVEVYAISTQTRPKAMTDAWLESHRNEMLVTPAARDMGMVHYTLYLAELVRRAGGKLYFLREIGTLSDVYRRIAQTLSAQYMLGYYPTAGLTKPGWRTLRVELTNRARGQKAPTTPPGTLNSAPDSTHGARIVHRVAYYVPAEL